MVKIRLTEAARYRLSLILAVIVWILVLTGLVLAGVGAYIKFSLSEYTQLVENYDGNSLPIFLGVTGGLVAVVHVIGGIYLLTVSDPAKRQQYGHLFNALLAALGVATVLILIGAIMCFAHINHLHDSFDGGISTAMSVYGEQAHIKEEIDLLQMNFQCCGNDKYQDWHSVPWNTVYKEPDSVPFSCCDPKSNRPCVMHAVHNNARHHNYNWQTDLTLHQRGCREALMDYFGDVILKNCACVILGMFVLEAILVVVTRLLQTSMMAAVAAGNPRAPAEGYIILCGDEDAGSGKKPLLPTTIASGSESDIGDGALSVYGSDMMSARGARASIRAMLPPSRTGSRRSLGMARVTSGGLPPLGPRDSLLSSGYMNIRDSQLHLGSASGLGRPVEVHSGNWGSYPIPPPPPPPPPPPLPNY